MPCRPPDRTELVTAMFVLHEIFALGQDVIVEYLTQLRLRLPEHAHLLIIEVTPPRTDVATPEPFTPEYCFLHSVMKQVLAPEATWRDLLRRSGFTVKHVAPIKMPGAIAIVSQSMAHGG